MTFKTNETGLSRLLVIARRQYSLLSVHQLEAAGFTAQKRWRLVHKGWLSPVFPNVYRLCGVAPTWRGTVMAATLAIGGDAVLSHWTAGALWGLVEADDLEGRIEVTASRCIRMEGIVSHRNRLDADEVTTLHQVPVTRIERTLLDMSEGRSPRRIGDLVDEALRLKLTSPAKLAATVERHRRRGERRLATMRKVLSTRGAGYDAGDSPWEREMDDMWDLMGLPPAERQQWIALPGGWRYRPDRVIRSVKLAVEWDGDEHHGRRSDFERDIERRNRFVAAGWTVLDFHWHQGQREICSTVLKVYRRLTSTNVPAS